MNKRANVYINFYDFIFFILSFTCLVLFILLGQMNIHIPGIFRYTLFVIGALSGFVFIAMEVVLFLVMNFKSKLIYLLYLGTELGLALFINSKIPFSFFIVFVIFKLIKDILRVVLVNKIYKNKVFDKYCKLLGIKIRDFKKKPIKKKMVFMDDQLVIGDNTSKIKSRKTFEVGT